MMKVQKHFASFSEAIREGAKIRPKQCTGQFFDGTATCVYGAALEAILGEPPREEIITEYWNELQPILKADYGYLSTLTDLPCGCREVTDGPNSGTRTDPSLLNISVHLNNAHQWSKTRIADWLESEEEKLGYVLLSEDLRKSRLPMLSPLPRLLRVAG